METSAQSPDTAISSSPAADAPAFSLTAAAVTQVKTVITQQGFDGHHLVVRVVPAGCSGLGYDLNLVKDLKQGDLTWKQAGISIATDAMSLNYLKGTVVDYVVSDTQAGFKFENPNAKSNCGCGSSFST